MQFSNLPPELQGLILKFFFNSWTNLPNIRKSVQDSKIHSRILTDALFGLPLARYSEMLKFNQEIRRKKKKRGGTGNPKSKIFSTQRNKILYSRRWGLSYFFQNWSSLNLDSNRGLFVSRGCWRFWVFLPRVHVCLGASLSVTETST